MMTKAKTALISVCTLTLSLALVFPLWSQDKKGDDKKAEKKKAEKISGDVGLMDLEKNYMILVTKDGKLVTLDFDQKTKVLKTETSGAKMDEVGLGSSAVVEYQVKEDKSLEAKIKAAEEQLNHLQNDQKRIVTKMDFKPAKGE